MERRCAIATGARGMDHEVELTVRGFPRIHLTLIDLGGTTHRAYGGVGLFLDGLATVVTVRTSKNLQFSYPGNLETRARAEIDAAVERLSHHCAPMSGDVKVSTSVSQHVGLGSKTTLIPTSPPD